jgi:hypothetical protein
MKRRLAVAAAALAVLGAACSGGGGDDGGGPGPLAGGERPNLQLASSLRRLDSCDGLRSWMRDELAPRVGAYGFSGMPMPGGGRGGDVVIMEDSAAAAESADRSLATEAPGAAPAPSVPGAPSQDDGSGFSTTNVQVAGVDEPDIVKTDGRRILAIAENKLHLASVEGGALVSSIELPEGMYDGQMLLAGDRVLVFGAGSYDDVVPLAEEAGADIARSILPIGTTRVLEVAIDGDTLVAGETYELDGTYVAARMTGDVARIVVHDESTARLPLVTPAVPGAAAEEQATALNRQVVEEADPESLLPAWRQVVAEGEQGAEGKLLSCEDTHAPNTFSGFGVVSVVTVDLSEGVGAGLASAAGTGVLASGQTVYASPEHLYVAAPEWIDWAALSEEAGGTPPDVEQGTDIHRFDITDPSRAAYELSGHVDGTLLNQFAMDEHDGYVRVATTTGQAWSEQDTSESHVVVLGPGAGALTTVGSVSGLGRGEAIHSVRFLGDVAYVVTFRQTDPLYTVDLSDPTAPAVTGELKILGYSAYLHPIGDGRLIGVGQDATEEGRVTGTQVALYDVRDPASPQRVAQAVLPDSTSGAEWDHHAFLWWPDTGLVAVPVSAYGHQGAFEGLVGFGVDADAATIAEVGRVSHPPVTEPGVGRPIPIEPGAGGGSEPVTQADEFGPFQYTPPIQRVLVVGDTLWTLSSEGLAASDLATLGGTTFLPFG